MKILRSISFLVVLIFVGCAGSSTDTNVVGEFESRTGIVCPDGIMHSKVTRSQVGDSYTEYYQLGCDNKVAETVIERLGLSQSSYRPYKRSPNAPKNWTDPKSEPLSKEKFTDVAIGSNLKAWYDEGSKTLHVQASMWQ